MMGWQSRSTCSARPLGRWLRWLTSQMRGPSCYKAVVALAERLQPLSQHPRKQQKGAVAKVAAKIHVAFLAIALVLLNWPDTNLPSRYITGFRSLGMLESTGVLRQIPRIDPLPVKELLARAPAASAALSSGIPIARFLLAKFARFRIDEAARLHAAVLTDGHTTARLHASC